VATKPSIGRVGELAWPQKTHPSNRIPDGCSGSGQSASPETRFSQDDLADSFPKALHGFVARRSAFDPLTRETKPSRSIFVTGRYETERILPASSKNSKPAMDVRGCGRQTWVYYTLLWPAKKSGELTDLCLPSSRAAGKMGRCSSATVEINALNNVRVRQVALSDQRIRKRELLVARVQNSGHNTLGAFGYNTPLPSPGEDTNRSWSGCDRASGRGLSKVDVIKMDIEGAELSALHGALNYASARPPSSCLLELAGSPFAASECEQCENCSSLLGQHGYRMLRLRFPSTGLPCHFSCGETIFDSEQYCRDPRKIPFPW